MCYLRFLNVPTYLLYRHTPTSTVIARTCCAISGVVKSSCYVTLANENRGFPMKLRFCLEFYRTHCKFPFQSKFC